MKKDVEKLQSLQCEIETMKEYQAPFDFQLEEKARLCRKLERDLDTLVFECDYFMKQHRGIE